VKDLQIFSYHNLNFFIWKINNAQFILLLLQECDENEQVHDSEAKLEGCLFVDYFFLYF
jgi:hypothetical protein